MHCTARQLSPAKTWEDDFQCRTTRKAIFKSLIEQPPHPASMPTAFLNKQLRVTRKFLGSFIRIWSGDLSNARQYTRLTKPTPPIKPCIYCMQIQVRLLHLSSNDDTLLKFKLKKVYFERRFEYLSWKCYILYTHNLPWWLQVQVFFFLQMKHETCSQDR